MLFCIYFLFLSFILESASRRMETKGVESPLRGRARKTNEGFVKNNRNSQIFYIYGQISFSHPFFIITIPSLISFFFCRQQKASTTTKPSKLLNFISFGQLFLGTVSRVSQFFLQRKQLFQILFMFLFLFVVVLDLCFSFVLFILFFHMFVLILFLDLIFKIFIGRNASACDRKLRSHILNGTQLSKHAWKARLGDHF